MATVKISDLPEIPHLTFDTTQSILPVVDLTTNTTGKVTVRTLAEGLFHNDALKVGEEAILFPNVIAQFAGNSEIYLQVNLQNLNANGSADYVATADIGTNANNYIDLGINNSNYNDPEYSALKSLDGYLYVQGSLDNSADGNLVIGTASTGANVVFIAGGTTEANVIAKMTRFGLTLNGASRLEFSDGSIQTVAAAPASLSQNAYNTANSASSNTIVIQAVNITQNNNIIAINQYAQSAFATANDTNGFAVSAFNTANAVNGFAISAFNTANGANGLAAGAFDKANNALANTFAITVNNSVYIPGTLVIDGLIYANGATYVANAMSIPTTYSSPQTAITLDYRAANIVKTNITSDLVVSHTGIVLGKYIDLFVYNDSAATRNITHGVSANNSSTKGTVTEVRPYATKHLKYFTVDSDLANTYVVIATDENYVSGDLTVTGNVVSEGGSVVTSNLYVGGTTTSVGTTLMEGNFTSNGTSNLIGSVIVTGTFSTEGTLSLNNSTFTSNTALLSITASDDFVTQSPSNTNYMLHVTGKANSVTRVVLDSFGANTYPLFAGRMGRGSAAAPAAVANNDVMFRVVGNGWTGTEFPGSSPTKIDFVATEDFSDTNRGTAIEFWNTPVGSNNIQRIATFNAGEAKFTGAVIPEKGFVFVPRLPVGNQTAITIDFDTDSMVKATHIADLTVTLTNFQSGKIVEVWLVNTGGQNRTVTHGCTALNSTNKSTTVTNIAGSSLCLRYFSIGTDNANTFVSIIGA
jgi:hypothetical protein